MSFLGNRPLTRVSRQVRNIFTRRARGVQVDFGESVRARWRGFRAYQTSAWLHPKKRSGSH
jgi:hypothetical protein